MSSLPILGCMRSRAFCFIFWLSAFSRYACRISPAGHGSPSNENSELKAQRSKLAAGRRLQARPQAGGATVQQG